MSLPPIPFFVMSPAIWPAISFLGSAIIHSDLDVPGI